MKLVLLSDTHGCHEDLVVPDGDVLIHAGDFSRWEGTVEELRAFDAFLGSLPHRHKVLVAGNHDWCFQREPEASRAAVTNAIYLEDEALEIEGVKFYGSPWQPVFLDWAFNLPEDDLREKWSQIPSDVDVLITHGPPQGIGDRVFNGTHVGSVELTARLETLDPRLHVFGHIHESRGVFEGDGTTFINASSPNKSCTPFVFEL